MGEPAVAKSKLVNDYLFTRAFAQERPVIAVNLIFHSLMVGLLPFKGSNFTPVVFQVAEKFVVIDEYKTLTSLSCI